MQSNTNRFPGIDPFIEVTGIWESFHNSMVVHLSDSLNLLLPDNYAATVEVRIELFERDDQWKRRPDVAVVTDEASPAWSSPGRGGAATMAALEVEPITLTLPQIDESKVTYVDILRLPDRELVTSIELLSPSNKSGSERGSYLRKRNEMVGRGINLVEMDLLLSGQRMEFLEPLPAGDYYVMTSRADRRPKCDVYSWGLRHKLPQIPIPLKAGEPDVPVDLNAIFNTTFDRGRYSRLLRYDLPLPKSIGATDKAWVESILQSGLNPSKVS